MPSRSAPPSLPARSRAQALSRGALLCALTAVLAQVAVPLPPVPLTLSLLGVLLCGALLGARQGALAVGAYLFMGACSLPVFAGFSGGPGALLGPTGGFLLGYLPCAAITGALVRRFGLRMPALCLSMAAGTAACYACGTAWYTASAGVPLPAALAACVLPFLPGDAVKIVLAAALTQRIRPLLARS